MNTKAIERCIDNGSDVRDALEAQVELYAIEAELELLRNDSKLLLALQAAGVNNWDGYEYALENLDL